MIDADGKLPRQVPQAPHPAPDRASGRSTTSGPATSATRCSRRPSARSASTSATTGTSPRAGARSGSTARRSSSTRRRPVAGLSQYLWKLEQPAAAVANEYFIGAINRVGTEELGDGKFYGTSYFVDPEGQMVGEARRHTRRRADRARPGHGPASHEVRNTLGVLPRPPAGRLRRPGPPVSDAAPVPTRRGAVMRTLISGGTVVNRPGRAGRCPDRRRDDRGGARRPAAPRSAPTLTADAGDRRDREVRDPRRRSTPTPTWRCRSAAPRDRHFETGTARRGLGRHDHDHRLRHPDHRRARCPRGWPHWHAKADGSCAIDYGFHMILAASTTTRSRRWTSWSRRGRHAASSCSWPTPASSTATTGRSCGPCSRPRATARSS